MLFKKNPAPTPELVAFVFFDEQITPNLDEICFNASRLLKASDSVAQCQVEILEQKQDQIGFLVGENSGCLLTRMLGAFPADKIDPTDPNRQRVLDAQEHWGLVFLSDTHRMSRLTGIIKLSAMMQSVSMAHRVRALIPSPLGVVFRASEWAETMQRFIREKTVPLSHWVGYDFREESGRTDAASIYMDELFGIPNIEILGSERSSDETVDLLECAVIESILRGPIHKSSKQWVTKSGVRFQVRYARSLYDPDRKSTQLMEL